MLANYVVLVVVVVVVVVNVNFGKRAIRILGNFHTLGLVKDMGFGMLLQQCDGKFCYKTDRVRFLFI